MSLSHAVHSFSLQKGVSIAVSAYYILHSFVFSALIYCKEGIKFCAVVRAFFLPGILSGISVGAAYLLSQAPIFNTHPLLQIATILLLGSLLYMTLAFLFLPTLLQEFWGACVKSALINR
jgi:hypothetical protein